MHILTCLPALRRSKGWLFAWVLALLLTFTASIANAQSGYPQRIDPAINDFADLLSPTDATAVRSMLQELRRDTGKELVVVTIASIDQYSTADKTIESFATNLFNSWGIGDRQRNDGVMLLVAVNDRRVRIELGDGYPHSVDEDMAIVIDSMILPSFKRDDYSQGIVQGVQGVIGKLTGRTVAAPDVAPAPAGDGASMQGVASGPSIPPIAGVGGAAGLLGAAALGFRQYTRHRQRRCPSCQTMMQRLDETADDMHLDSGQQLEEYLSSIDYDVWKCSSCNMHTLLPYPRWFSGYKQCPSCSYRTLQVESQTVVAPTYSSTGRKRVTRDCRQCSYHDEDMVSIPQLTRSSSSSSGGGSSSSGGGRSSGGGASGSW